MEIKGKYFGEENPGLATEIGNLGLLYHSQGKLELSE